MATLPPAPCHGTAKNFGLAFITLLLDAALVLRLSYHNSFLVPVPTMCLYLDDLTTVTFFGTKAGEDDCAGEFVEEEACCVAGEEVAEDEELDEDGVASCLEGAE